ncbi:MAG: DNA repair protein RecO [Verrucomicrobia bacterium]|nr:DNA repair protein RecO [Verrucomicrobiota bacterium]
MILKTEAVVLRTIPYSNTSLVAIWLTESGQRLATLIKGARRPKSAFLGQLDLFYRCELLYYRRHRDGLHMISACSPIDNRSALRQDWRACAAASYVSHLLQQTATEGDGSHPQLFRLADQTLSHLTTSSKCQELMYWFELQLLSMLGFAPQLDSCAGCRCPTVNGQGTRFSWVRGGVVCDRCATARDSDAISADILAVLRRWAGDPDARTLRTIRCSREQMLVIHRLLGMFSAYHLDIKPDNRQIAIDLMTTRSQPDNSEN